MKSRRSTRLNTAIAAVITAGHPDRTPQPAVACCRTASRIGDPEEHITPVRTGRYHRPGGQASLDDLRGVI